MPENTIIFQSSYNKVADICEESKKFLCENGADSHIANAVEICLMESLNNVIKHSYKGDQNKEIELTIKFDKKELELKIIDTGLSRDNFDNPSLDYDPEDIENLPEGGMGLFIISQLMDKLDYITINGKNIFSMYKKLI
ncbi:MAG: ATP-binding protein [Melioribacteraceae bacterium]